jgi:hypothetical protein
MTGNIKIIIDGYKIYQYLLLISGDPFISCRPFVPEDLCRPNPCGQGAICTPGHDNTGKERPVCRCVKILLKHARFLN